MLKKIWKKIGPNPLDRLLKKAAKQGCKTVLIPWNRGLGDIALGLYAITQRVRDFIPDAQITFITRKDLKDGFALLKGVDVIVAPEWSRGKPTPLPSNLPSFDLVIDHADPSYWVAWQRGKLIPKMEWNPAWDALCNRFQLPSNCIAAHVHCETGYYFERNWPFEHWQKLFHSLVGPIILLGIKKEPVFHHPHLFDLRGETSLFEMLAILKNHCRVLIAPDSGVLGLTYFLNTPFQLRIVSLWADPNHGILKQNVPSPNPLLEHIPVISLNRKDAALISVADVKKAIKPLQPVTEYDLPTDEARSLGEKLISQGKVACLILAGGQGSRLASQQPKALAIVQKKTLLQLLCEKNTAASKMALMTSPDNHDTIENYLKEHNYFGLQLSLFKQGTTQFLTDTGEKIGMGPDGNGHALRHLMMSGIGKEWKEQGIEYVMVVPIDNPLADPFDASLCGYHAMTKREATIKAILRTDSTEKVGVIIRHEGKIGVQEYSELPDHFEAPLAHIGLFCFSLSFIERVAIHELPWHFARKKYQEQFVWKPEKFLFDVLAFAENIGIVVYPREDVYAPLKNASGPNSLATVQQALLDFDRRHFGTPR